MIKHDYYRLYASGAVSNSLTLSMSEVLDHIDYNKRLRPGCAQFVDGECVYGGISVSEALISQHEAAWTQKLPVDTKA
jgi:hypothetical protein